MRAPPLACAHASATGDAPVAGLYRTESISVPRHSGASAPYRLLSRGWSR